MIRPPKIYTQQQWRGEPMRRIFARQPAIGIVIHHTATPNVLVPPGEEEARALALARRIQESHLERGWADAGHHFLVTRGGLILEGRRGSARAARQGLVVRGAHAGDSRANAQMWGIEVEGTYLHTLRLPAEQWKALVTLCGWLAFWGKLNLARQENPVIHGHREFRATACPGLLMELLPELRKEAREVKVAILEDRKLAVEEP